MGAFNSLRKYLSGLAPISSAEWELIVPLLVPRELKRGEYFVRIGEQRREVAYVVRGLIRKYYLDGNGKEFTNGFAMDNQLAAPYESLLSGEPAEADLIAEEDCNLILLSYDRFLETAQKSLAWKEVSLKIAEGMLLQREKRQARMLMKDAGARYEDFLRENRALAARVPDYLIASYLGMTPETLSRVRKKRGE